METPIFAVFDSKAECYGRPLFIASRGLAVRSFTDEVNRDAPDNAMFKHSADFRLCLIGLWDDATGSFSTPTVPEILCWGSSVSLKEY